MNKADRFIFALLVQLSFFVEVLWYVLLPLYGEIKMFQILGALVPWSLLPREWRPSAQLNTDLNEAAAHGRGSGGRLAVAYYYFSGFIRTAEVAWGRWCQWVETDQASLVGSDVDDIDR